MGYFKMITESQSWTCPKTAEYQIICVAGGCSGRSAQDTTKQNIAGGATSFGSYLTASGGLANVTAGSSANGVNGYCLNGNLYGTINPNNVFADSIWGTGFGAGGAGHYNSPAVPGGNCGNMNMGIFNITQGANVSCTIGQGGARGTTGASVGFDGVIVIREV